MDIDPEIRLPVLGAAWIPLSKGLWALVDDWLVEDIPRFKAKEPHAPGHQGQTYYGGIKTWINGKERHLSLHQWVWQQYRIPLPPDQIDHINGLGWDCRISNLRTATNMQNQWNRGPQRNSKTGLKGVCWDNKKEKWQAQIQINKKHKNLGHYDTKEAAARVHDAWAKEAFGKYAWLNYPDF